MSVVVEAQTIPLREDSSGTFRVGNTRVRLDTVIYAFNTGHTAEEIVSQYPPLNLADVYAVIAYYLNNRQTVDEYIRRGEEEAEKIQTEMESRPDYQLFREHILARHQALQARNNS
jgi:uncharacterized protein (DUF433 family)